MFYNLKVFTLMAGLTALFVVIGGAIGGEQGAIVALFLAGAMNFFAYFNSGKAALRAFGADRAGAEFSGPPLDLASALQKLDAAARRIPMPVAPSYAPIAQVDPLQAYGRGLLSLFSTHPPMAERVGRLQEIARESLRRPAAG